MIQIQNYTDQFQTAEEIVYPNVSVRTVDITRVVDAEFLFGSVDAKEAINAWRQKGAETGRDSKHIAGAEHADGTDLFTEVTGQFNSWKEDESVWDDDEQVYVSLSDFTVDEITVCFTEDVDEMFDENHEG